MVAQSLFQAIVIAAVREHALETFIATVRDAPSLDPTRTSEDIPSVAQPMDEKEDTRPKDHNSAIL